MSLKQVLVEQQMLKNQMLLESIVVDMLPEQKKIVEGIYNEFKPLIEATLSPEQITQVFQDVEKNSRNLLGKGIDAAKWVNQAVDNVGKWLQNTTPVKNFDAQFDKLKNTINTKFPDNKLLDGISKMGMWAKENPGKTAAIIGVLTTLASLAAGPVGGAVAGQILRGTSELLKGEKLSTAIGKGIKTAAIGWLAGKGIEEVGDWVRKVTTTLKPLPIEGFGRYYREEIGTGLPSTYQDAAIFGTKDEIGQFNQMWADAARKWENHDFSGAEAAFAKAQDFATDITEKTMNQIASGDDPYATVNAINKAIEGFKAAAQGAAAGAGAGGLSGGNTQAKPEAPKPTGQQAQAADKLGGFVGSGAAESIVNNNIALTESQIINLFETVELSEGPLDRLKQLAGSVGQGVSNFGKKMTHSVTADQLQQAWQKAGKPTDSAAVAKVLQGAGVNPETISTVYKNAGIEDTPADWPEGVPKFNKHTGEKFANPEQAKAFMATPEYKMDSDEYDQAQATKSAPTAPKTPSLKDKLSKAFNVDGMKDAAKQGYEAGKKFGDDLSGQTNFAGQDAFGSMASTLAPSNKPDLEPEKTTSSTGGTIQQVGNRTIHRAKQPQAEPAAEPAAEPQQDQSLDLDQLKQQSAQKRAQGQADQQQAMQQMKQTADANAAKSAADKQTTDAAKAAAAKPGFQRTPQDKLAIKAAKQKGLIPQSTPESINKTKGNSIMENELNMLRKLIGLPAAVVEAEEKCSECGEVHEGACDVKESALIESKQGFVVLDTSLIDQISPMDGTEVDTDEDEEGNIVGATVWSNNPNVTATLMKFAKTNPHRLKVSSEMSTPANQARPIGNKFSPDNSPALEGRILDDDEQPWHGIDDPELLQDLIADAQVMDADEFYDTHSSLLDDAYEFWENYHEGLEEQVNECGEMPMMSPMSAVGDTDAMAAVIAPDMAEPEAMMPQEQPEEKASYTLSIRNGDSTLTMTTDAPDEIIHVMKLAGVKGEAKVEKAAPAQEKPEQSEGEEKVDEWANTPDATREKEPTGYGDIRDWGFKGTGKGNEKYPGTKASGDNPLSEAAILADYKAFKGGK